MSALPTGHYVADSSWLHRLDARAKIVGFFLLLSAIVSAPSLWGYGFVLCVAAIIVALSRLPLRHALGPLRRLWLFFLVIFAMNVLFFDSADPLWVWWIFTVSAEGVAQGVNVVCNVLLIMVLANILTGTTAPMDMTWAVASLFQPLKLLRVPVEDVAMIVSAAIQFIPTLMDETDTIKKAQIARGARFESKRLTERAASFLPLIIPIFLAAFRRADDLATAMEARGYRNAQNRTKKNGHPFHLSDIVALASCAAVCLLQLYVLR